MANWTLTGELGSGKSITAVGRQRDFLMQGRPLASNMDLFLDKLMPPMSRATYTRLMDFPTAEDLWNLGHACPEKDESKFGGLFLDELAVFLNSREWQGKARDQVIKYLRHVRKRHWHTFFLTQDIESLDAQARRALIEHKVSCKRTDRLSIPLIGWLLRLLGMSGTLPRMHVGIVRYGKDDRSPVVETWKYFGTKLHDAYNTDQEYRDQPYRDVETPEYWLHTRPFNTPVLIPRGTRNITFEQEGTYTVLSAWHLKGRYLNFYQRHKPTIKALFLLSAAVYGFFFWIDNAQQLKQAVTIKPEIVYEQASAYMLIGDRAIVTTAQGNVLEATEYTRTDTKLIFKVGTQWYEKSL